MGAELIDDGVLDLLGDELRVNQLLRATRSTDGQGLSCRQMVAPVNHLGAGVEIIRTHHRPFSQQQNHPVAEPRENDDAIG